MLDGHQLTVESADFFRRVTEALERYGEVLSATTRPRRDAWLCSVEFPGVLDLPAALFYERLLRRSKDLEGVPRWKLMRGFEGCNGWDVRFGHSAPTPSQRMNEFSSYSATELAELIRERSASSTEIVEACIKDIEDLNPKLNAVVETRFADARAEARVADEAIASGSDDLPPLHGVPCSIKEAIHLEGMPNTSGIVSRKGIHSMTDATTVARLRGAGAIPLGVTNTSEGCMWMESSNAVYGLTRNPYDQSRTVGGSSGGEGAVVGAGIAPFGLGSDVGGSIRMPAFFNGVFGHKASGGLIPNTGQYPVANTVQGLRYLTTGPLCRFADDLYPLVKLLAGPDGMDIGCRDIRLKDPGTVDARHLRVINVPGNTRFKRASDELLNAQNDAAEALKSLGASVETRQIEEFNDSLEIWSAMLGDASDERFGETIGIHSRFQLLREVLRAPFGRSPHTIPALGLAVIDTPLADKFQRKDKAKRAGRELREKLETMLGNDGVMLFPSHAVVAPRHNVPILTLFNWVYTAIFNVLELPVTQVPLGLNERGLPLGVQVVAAHGNDHLTIAAAKMLEDTLGGWVGPIGHR